MQGRLAKIAANNFNSVRYQPPSVESRRAIYKKLTPNPNWYDDLRRDVGAINVAAIAGAGSYDPRLRKRFVVNNYYSAFDEHPKFDSVYLRQPELAATIPIIRDAEMMERLYDSSSNGFIVSDNKRKPRILINDTLSPGLQTATVIHELAHNALGHINNQSIPTAIKEFQAEAVARGVRERLGFKNPASVRSSGAYITNNLIDLAGQGITPKQIFAENYPAVASAVESLVPIPAQPFLSIVPQLYSDFSFFSR